MTIDKEVSKIIKEQRYIQAIFKYGIIPVTLVLQEYENLENFEECEIIFKSITYLNKHLPILEGEEDLLPTNYSEKTLKNTLSEFQKYGFKGDIFQNNIPYYIQEIKKMVA